MLCFYYYFCQCGAFLFNSGDVVKSVIGDGRNYLFVDGENSKLPVYKNQKTYQRIVMSAKVHLVDITTTTIQDSKQCTVS